MGEVIYRVEDAFRCYGGEPPESVLKCGEISEMGVRYRVTDEDVFKDNESGESYFKVSNHAFPFAYKCDFRNRLKNDLKFNVYKGTSSGFVPPVSSLLRAVKYLNKGSISFRMCLSGDEYLRKALLEIFNIEYLLKKEAKDISWTVLTLVGLREVLTALRVSKVGEPLFLAKASSEEGFEIVEYCRDVLLGMLSKGKAVLPLPENLENQ